MFGASCVNDHDLSSQVFIFPLLSPSNTGIALKSWLLWVLVDHSFILWCIEYATAMVPRNTNEPLGPEKEEERFRWFWEFFWKGTVPAVEC